MIELDVVGAIIADWGQYDQDGEEVTPPVYLAGHHVNAPEVIPEFSEWLLDPQPTTPYRVYAGRMPVCYRFPDQETFENAIAVFQTE